MKKKNMKIARILFIFFILIIVIAFLILAKIQSFGIPKNLSKEETIAMINSSLQQSYKNARIEFVSINSSKLHPGYWEVNVVVSKNPNSPCPETFVLEYDTFYGLDWKIQNNLTRNCIVFGAENNTNYIYGRREEAMSRASQFDFVKNFIYSCNQNIYVDATPTMVNSTAAWSVSYSCGSKSLNVLITQKRGELISAS